MKRAFWSQDMLLLKWPVLLLVICAVASVVWCGSAFKFREMAILATQAAQANREQMAGAVLKIEEEAKAIRTYRDRYDQLQTRGVIGEEERLQLVEALGRFRERHKLYAVQFEMDKQVEIPLKEGEPEDAGPWLSLRSSQIRIGMPLLHEEDLLRLLAELRRVGRGMFVVEECSLTRTNLEAVSEVLKVNENLLASCTILWLTLKPEENQPGAGLEEAPPEL